MTPWRAEPNGQYWFVGFGLNVSTDRDTRTSVDDDWYNVGNYFASSQSAQMAADCLKAGLQYINGGAGLDNLIEKLIEARKGLKR